MQHVLTNRWRAASASVTLFAPLFLVVMPVTMLSEILARRVGWPTMLVFAYIEIAILITYATVLLSMASGSGPRAAHGLHRVVRWLVTSAGYVGIVAPPALWCAAALSKVAGVAGSLALFLLSLLTTAGAIMLMLGPALAATSEYSPSRALRESFMIMARVWWRPLVWGALPLASAILMDQLFPWDGVPWHAAQILLSRVLTSALSLPAILIVAIYAVENETHSSIGSIQIGRLPRGLVLLAAALSPVPVAAAIYLFLQALVPVSVQIAAVLPIPGPSAIIGYLPISPATFVLFVVPGLAAGWMAYRTAFVRWPGFLAGFCYRLLVLSCEIGRTQFQEPWVRLTHLYVLGLVLSGAVGLGGAALSAWAYRRGRAAVA